MFIIGYIPTAIIAATTHKRALENRSGRSANAGLRPGLAGSRGVADLRPATRDPERPGPWPGVARVMTRAGRALPAGLPGLLPRRQLSYLVQLVFEGSGLESGSVINSYSAHPRCRAPRPRAACRGQVGAAAACSMP